MKVASVEAIARALDQAGVPCLVVGGLAVNAHGYGRMTQDLDLVVKLSPEHARGLFTALSGLGYRPRVPVTAEGFGDPEQRARWISDAHRETPVDVFVAEPFDFDREYRRALVVEVAPGVRLRILALPALARLKRAAARPQDLADLAELRLLHGEIADE